jgi:hypothetical protein
MLRTPQAIRLHLNYLNGSPAPQAQSASSPKQESDQSLWTGVSDEIADWLTESSQEVAEDRRATR